MGRFLLDEHNHPTLAKKLRELGHEAYHRFPRRVHFRRQNEIFLAAIASLDEREIPGSIIIVSPEGIRTRRK